MKYIKTHKTLIVALVLFSAWITYGAIRCKQESGWVKLELEEKNPTEYIYPVNEDRVMDVIDKMLTAKIPTIKNLHTRWKIY